jgi:hypothetical protein
MRMEGEVSERRKKGKMKSEDGNRKKEIGLNGRRKSSIGKERTIAIDPWHSFSSSYTIIW